MNKNKINIEAPRTRRTSQMPQQKNKRKHNKKMMRVVIYITLVIFVLSLLLLIGLGIYKLSTSPKYRLNKVTFEGNVKYAYDELREAINIEDGTNLFKISKSKIKSALEQLPYIDKVKISKKYPNTLVVKIVEHSCYFFAYNKETDKYIKLTKQGVILEECTVEAKLENELYVFGINFDDNIGKEVLEIEKAKLLNYLSIKEQYDKVNIDKEITSVEFKEGNIILTLNYDINVIMNTEEIGYKLSFLKNILDEIPGKSGIIDMTVERPIFTGTIK